MTIIWCMVPEIWSTTDRIFYHSGLFLALLTPYGLRKSNFWKNEKNTWRYHFTYHKWQSYDIWFQRYGVQWTIFFCHFGLFFFCPFTLLKTQKIKILKKWQKPTEDLSFYTGVAWISKFWKIKNFEIMKKNTWRY